METIKIFVGTEPLQYIPQMVLADSIRRTTSSPFEIKFCTQQQKRMGGTNFGFVRFMVPSYCNFEGKGIYLDADQLVLQDIKGLWNALPEGSDVGFVQDAEGFFGDRPAVRANHTSVMIMRCDMLKTWDPSKIFDRVVHNKTEQLAEGQMRYRDFMYLNWHDLSKMTPLDPRWNHLNILRDDTKLVHFTHVASQPWRNPKHRLAEFWETNLRQSISSGAIKKTEIIREIAKRHLHPHYLRCLSVKLA